MGKKGFLGWLKLARVVVPGVAFLLLVTLILKGQTADGQSMLCPQLAYAQSPALTISKSASPDPVVAGGKLTYVITITNTQSTALTGVVVRDMVPEHTTFSSVNSRGGQWIMRSPGGGKRGEVSWEAAEPLLPDQTAHLEMVVRVEEGWAGLVVNADYGATVGGVDDPVIGQPVTTHVVQPTPTATPTPTNTPTLTDTTSPTGGISVNGSAKESAHSRVLVQLWAMDDIGVTGMMVGIDASPTGTSWEPYTIKKELDLSDGLHTIYVKYRDAAGNESPIYSQQITVTNRVLPARLSINNGVTWTNTPNVSLELVGPLYAALLRIGNDGGLAGSAWEPYQLSRAWTLDVLPNQTATYAVYAIFQDAWGDFSAVVNDTIIYDPLPPTGSISLKDPLGEQNAGSSTLSLTLSAQDDPNGSGVGQMRISSSKDFDGTGWISYTTSYEWVADDETVYVQFRDNAGNESEVYSLTIKGPQSFTIHLPIISR